MAQVGLKVEDLAKIKIRVRFNMNLTWKITQLICHITRCCNKKKQHDTEEKKVLIVTA